MAEFNQFGSARQGQAGDAKVCSQFEAMLAEAVDGSLPAEEQATFDLHLVGCASCREMLGDAKRGAVWMEMLREHAPAPPTALLDRILAQTSGAASVEIGAAGAAGVASAMVAGGAGPVGSGLGAAATGNVLAFRKRAVRGFGGFDFEGLRHTLLQPRLAMTAAMAFFSIALTLNLTGVRLSELRVSDLRPSSLKRSMYEANAHVVRYYTNLRVVYELESRVHDLQRSSDNDAPSTPMVAPEAESGAPGPEGAEPGTNSGTKGKRQEKEPRQRVSPGTSRREPIREPVGEDRRVLATLRDGALAGTGFAGGDRDRAAVLPFGASMAAQEEGTV